MNIRKLDVDDVDYAYGVWCRAHKRSPGCRGASLEVYLAMYGTLLRKLIDDPTTVRLGAYDERDRLLGFLVMTPGKRVDTLHWCQVKQKLDGERVKDRRRIFFELIDAAELGERFVYTLQGPRLRSGAGAKSLDQLLVNDLRARGVTATFVALREWLK